MRGRLTIRRKQGHHKSSVLRRVNWIKRRAQESRVWETYVNVTLPFSDETRQAIVREMQEAGLIAPTSYWRDVNLDGLFALVRGDQK